VSFKRQQFTEPLHTV